MIPSTPFLMMGVGRGVLHEVRVAGQAGSVPVLRSEAIAAAGRVTVHAIELPRTHAGAHTPERRRVVLAQVTAVGVKVRIFEGRQIIMVVKRFPRPVGGGQRAGLGVAAGAGGG